MAAANHSSLQRAAALVPAVLGAIVVARAAGATPADAAVIASSVSGFEGGPALASDGRVRRRRHGLRRERRRGVRFRSGAVRLNTAGGTLTIPAAASAGDRWFAHREKPRGLGDYRIVSRARCRRAARPPFAAPLLGPRP
jgi:hypothetical protein